MRIARVYPGASLFGLDVSREMLATAASSIEKAGLSDRVRLAAGDATGFDSKVLLGRTHFDRVVFSFALSMIPRWREAMAQGLDVVAPGGTLTIVDFGDCARLPAPFTALLRRWLEAFDVEPRLELPPALHAAGEARGYAVACAPLFRGYSLLAKVSRAAAG